MISKNPEVLASNGIGNGSGNGSGNGKTTEPGASGVTESEKEKLPEKNQQRKWNIERTWNFSLEELFGLALRFFKEMNGKAFNPTYEENLRLVALQKHVSLGPYNPKLCSEVGFFDVLGNDRRKEWVRLGSLAKEDAMEDFVKQLNSCCSLFAPYVTSHAIEKEEQEKRQEEERQRAEREEQERRQQEQEEARRREEEARRREEEARRREEAERSLIELQKQQIMAALSAQTAVSFQQHAQQQFPDSPAQQQLLLQQLREQHYQQYIQQVYQVPQMALHQDCPMTSLQLPDEHDSASGVNPGSQSMSLQSSEYKPNSKQGHLYVEGNPGEVAIMAPSMWTRPDIKEFKKKMVDDVESVITVGRGEVVTVRVATHNNGSYLFWEFATDHYDVGFGLYFEWPNPANGTSPDNMETSVERQDTGQSENGKVETQPPSGRPAVREVVPVYRRDSHEEVYAGSHQYPGHGVYLLKFDNSYSLWRSKVVYYRVYYTR